ncbi:hypothetical protein HYPBUDRAFT_145902 [Hyphopichia burtonii NRRL Y-1933]|uniref:Transmembrane protein n=1 Tax=Hyphopichia burtonii NRRL Y-1933 TaxID=984485 RepID=A0A1E4RQI2_9ASCO|nr:hypothetical protein HYPBUDRAFT_145902 [Hyphopichia burtonii NRRL Y-1933]ODV69486.1 hypothetical protein HYPBUDRAFT_145902 [Hyphopichia burtonii NRRL Y-1933]
MVLSDQDLQSEYPPLYYRLGANQYEKSIEFYNADKQLSQNDRGQIFRDIQYVYGKSEFISFTTFILAMSTPTLYGLIKKRYYPQKEELQSPIIKETKKLPFFKRPVAKFFALSAISMGISLMAQVKAKSYYLNEKTNQISQLSNVNSQRQAQIWQKIDVFALPLFYFYYNLTFKNESLVIKDPKLMNDQDIRRIGMFQTSNKKASHFAEILPMKFCKEDGKIDESIVLKLLGINRNPNQVLDSEVSISTHWDQLRKENFPQESSENIEWVNPNSSSDSSTDVNDSSIDVNDASIDSNDSSNDKTNDPPSSSWDAIRRQNGK